MGNRNDRRRGHGSRGGIFGNENPHAEDVFGARANPKDERKTRQLCRQAYRALVGALAGECGDPVLQDLTVESVDPAPNASRLLVSVICPEQDPPMPLHEVLGRLEKAEGLLRHAVATAIVRKRAPELTFRVMPARETPR